MTEIIIALNGTGESKMGSGIVNIDIGDILEGAGSLVKSIGNQIRGKVPVDLMKLAELEVKMKELQNVVPTLLSDVDKAQTIINAEDAKSKSFWQSGWRPASAWTCVIALISNYLLFPLCTYLLTTFTNVTPVMPELDTTELLTLLFGLLGLSTLRTLDKKNK